MRKILFPLLIAGLCAVETQAQTNVGTVASSMSQPWGIATDPLNNDYYITESSAGDVLQSDPVFGIYAITQTPLNTPAGIVAARGGLIVAESGNHLIRRISLS